MPRLGEKVGIRRDLANPKSPKILKPIKVFCEGCGFKLGEMDRLTTPTFWIRNNIRGDLVIPKYEEAHYVYHCPECGRELGKRFKIWEEKKC